MVRRALLGLFPALLTALVFLCGTPGVSLGNEQAGAASWGAGVTAVAVAHGGLTTDPPDGATSQAADEDDIHDLPIVGVVVEFMWPDAAFEPQILNPSERAGPTHRPCAADPRAPPTA